LAPAFTHSDFATAIDRMYEAAACPELWPEALASFASSLGGFGGSIIGLSAQEKAIGYVSPETTEIAAAYARGGWREHNFRIELGAPLIRAGREFIHERMLLDRRGLDRQKIQNEFWNAFQMRSFIAFEFVPGQVGGSVERGTAEVEDWEIRELEGQAIISDGSAPSPQPGAPCLYGGSRAVSITCGPAPSCLTGAGGSSA
jgi:hypothetical protein